MVQLRRVDRPARWQPTTKRRGGRVLSMPAGQELVVVEPDVGGPYGDAAVIGSMAVGGEAPGVLGGRIGREFGIDRGGHTGHRYGSIFAHELGFSRGRNFDPGADKIGAHDCGGDVFPGITKEDLGWRYARSLESGGCDVYSTAFMGPVWAGFQRIVGLGPGALRAWRWHRPWGSMHYRAVCQVFAPAWLESLVARMRSGTTMSVATAAAIVGSWADGTQCRLPSNVVDKLVPYRRMSRKGNIVVEYAPVSTGGVLICPIMQIYELCNLGVWCQEIGTGNGPNAFRTAMSCALGVPGWEDGVVGCEYTDCTGDEIVARAFECMALAGVSGAAQDARFILPVHMNMLAECGWSYEMMEGKDGTECDILFASHKARRQLCEVADRRLRALISRPSADYRGVQSIVSMLMNRIHCRTWDVREYLDPRGRNVQ